MAGLEGSSQQTFRKGGPERVDVNAKDYRKREMSMKRNDLKLKASTLGLLGSLVLGGCAADMSTMEEPVPASTPAKVEYKPDVDAGVEVAMATPDPQKLQTLVASKIFLPRADASALLPIERRYEQSMQAERLASTEGWSIQVDPIILDPPPPVEPVPDPQPYRRLAGIIVGDTVMAIMITEGGETQIIRPGMRLPNSEWTVVSIDEEKAVLRRPGNRVPRQVIVNLESDPGMGTGGGNQGGGNPNPRGSGGGGRGNFGSGNNRGVDL